MGPLQTREIKPKCILPFTANIHTLTYIHDSQYKRSTWNTRHYFRVTRVAEVRDGAGGPIVVGSLLLGSFCLCTGIAGREREAGGSAEEFAFMVGEHVLIAVRVD